MKYVCVRVLDQWRKFKGILSKRTKTFKQRIAPTSRYKRIKATLESGLTEPYIAFCAFTSQDFEAFLVPFQNNQPMIHILYPAMCKPVSGVMRKFIKKRILLTYYVENIPIDVTKGTNHKSLKYIDIGAKAKSYSMRHYLSNDDEKHFKFYNECLNFYAKCTVYLQNHFVFKVSILKYAQYLHP